MKTDRVGLWLKRRGLPESVVDAVLLKSDVLKIRERYFDAFGCQPNLKNPRTFNEWLQHSKIYCRQKHHVTLADKLAVRDYIKEKSGFADFPEILWSGVSLAACDADKLPEQFIVKVNQGSGTNIVVSAKSQMDWSKIVREVDDLLSKDVSEFCGEWQYRWIKPQVFVEAFLNTPGSRGLVEYQFFCIRGSCAFVEVDFDRMSNHRRLYFDRSFQPLDMRIRLPAYEQSFAAPSFYGEMLAIAETLARDELFLRVDFYDIGRPVIGELTLHPGSGLVKFEPAAWDEKLGRLFVR